MARTDETKIREIIDLDDEFGTLAPFILMANELTTEACGSAGYSADRLELIERNLAAHFCRSKEQAVASEGVKGLTQSFQYKLGLNLAATKYGQDAMLMDTKGGLAQLSKNAEKGEGPVEIGIAHLGCSPRRRRW